ncbi:MAG: hypothetical protein Q8R92_14750 [Deltaproteobacteria bacterium]|nr:hypothetical protein [Deltaproteobacteria bacterium]
MDDAFLKTVYYTGIVVTFLVATVSYLWLRVSLSEVVAALAPSRLLSLFHRLLYPTLMLIAFMAFFGVNVRGCSFNPTYAEIAADNALIESWARAQFSAVFSRLSFILLCWAFLIGAAIVLSVRRRRQMAERQV